jgi:cytochrome c oxidase cbb3-type subunit 3
MSDNWSIFVIILVVGNILAMVWLLFSTSKSNDIKDSDTTGHVWDDIEELNNPLPRWWLGLFILTIIFAFAYLYFYPGLGNYKGSKEWSQMGQYQDRKQANLQEKAAYFKDLEGLSIEQLSSNQKALQTAQRLFANNCSTCHGSDAGGAKGFPNLRDNDWLYGGEPETLVTSIANGRSGVMPNLMLSRADVSVMAHYVKYLAGGDATAHVKEVGKQRFAICASCHGAEGKGNPVLGAPNLTDDVWLHGSQIWEIESILANGKTGNMPSFSDLLTDNEIRLLAAYILSLNEG